MGEIFDIQTVVVIGSGNVAGHLAKAFREAGRSILQVFSPDTGHASSLAEKVGAEVASRLFAVTKEADLYLLAVPDKKITTVAARLPLVKGIVCHTSGITPLNVLARFENYGVFYPLQTFSKERVPDISQVPFCLEASSDIVYNRLQTLAGKLSQRVYAVDSARRKNLHLAAVLVNNFPNYLYAEAEGFLKENHLSMKMLLPLMRETVAKIETMPAKEAQTGPAMRGDHETIDKHLKMLENKNDLRAVYQILTQQILKKYHE